MIVIKSRSVRNIIRVAVPFLLIPAQAILGVCVFDSKRSLIVSFSAVILSLFLFYAGFEKKNVGSRRIVLVSVFVALCIVGRFIPFFKPVAALTILGAIYLGSESGFLIGSLSAFLSDFYFGQGPWTLFQMLAWGLVGFFAGVFATPLKRNRVLLLIYGTLSGVLFSLVMDVWTVLWYNGSFELSLYFTAIINALPFVLLYAASNFAFLFFLASPFGEKLERIKIKYGI